MSLADHVNFHGAATLARAAGVGLVVLAWGQIDTRGRGRFKNVLRPPPSPQGSYPVFPGHGTGRVVEYDNHTTSCHVARALRGTPQLSCFAGLLGTGASGRP